MSPREEDSLSEEDELATAPESGQPFGGRENPWDADEPDDAGARHAFPADHRAPAGDDL